MSQGPLQATVAKTPANVQAPLNLDLGGSLRTTAAPKLTALNITAPTILKASAGRIARINVLVAGSTAGGVYDCLTTAAAAASNQISVIPTLTTAQISNLTIEANALLGLVIVPGTGQTLTATYE